MRWNSVLCLNQQILRSSMAEHYLIYCSHYISRKTSKAFVKSFIDINAYETIYYISLGKLVISTIIKQRTKILLCTRSHATCISKLMSSHHNRNSVITSSNGCCVPVGTNLKIIRKNIQESKNKSDQGMTPICSKN